MFLSWLKHAVKKASSNVAEPYLSRTSIGLPSSINTPFLIKPIYNIKQIHQYINIIFVFLIIMIKYLFTKSRNVGNKEIRCTERLFFFGNAFSIFFKKLDCIYFFFFIHSVFTSGKCIFMTINTHFFFFLIFLNIRIGLMYIYKKMISKF